MREYMGLYRGKQIDNDAWVYGSLLVFPNTKRTKILRWNQSDLEFDEYEVVPETVGECTGLRDMNDDLIFEGDLFHFDDDCVGVVILKDGCFRMQVYGMCDTFTENGYSEDGGGWGIVESEPIDRYYVRNLYIIGNVVDNPELWEGGANHADD